VFVVDGIITICLEIMNFSITWSPSQLSIFFSTLLRKAVWSCLPYSIIMTKNLVNRNS